MKRPAVVAERETREGPADVGVDVRRPLSLEIRREQQPLGAGIPASGLLVERPEVGAQDVVKPFERAGSREHHTHRMPRSRHGVAEDVEPRLGVDRVRGQHGEHDARGPEHDGQRPGPVDADPERAGRLVACAGDDRRLVHLGEPCGWNLERRADLVRPPPALDVEQQRPGRVGDVDHPLTGHPEAHVVLR